MGEGNPDVAEFTIKGLGKFKIKALTIGEEFDMLTQAERKNISNGIGTVTQSEITYEKIKHSILEYPGGTGAPTSPWLNSLKVGVMDVLVKKISELSSVELEEEKNTGDSKQLNTGETK